MAQGRSAKNISMIEWILTSWLSIKNSLSLRQFSTATLLLGNQVPSALYKHSLSMISCFTRAVAFNTHDLHESARGFEVARDGSLPRW